MKSTRRAVQYYTGGVLCLVQDRAHPQKCLSISWFLGWNVPGADNTNVVVETLLLKGMKRGRNQSHTTAARAGLPTGRSLRDGRHLFDLARRAGIGHSYSFVVPYDWIDRAAHEPMVWCNLLHNVRSSGLPSILDLGARLNML